MKNTIFFALTFLAYFFAVSCEDAVNSDDNLYIVPDFDYTILYSTIDEANNTGAIYQSDLNGNKTLWKDSTFFLNGINGNKLLLYYPVDYNAGIFKYKIHDFSINQTKELFDFQSIDKYAKILNDDNVILCEELYVESGACIVKNIKNNSEISISNSTTLRGILPAPDGSKFTYIDIDTPAYFLINSDGSNKKELNILLYGNPSCWTYDSERFISTLPITTSTYNVTQIYNVNPENDDKENLINIRKDISAPKLSPYNKKIAFGIKPDGIGTINADGSEFTILRNISQTEDVGFILSYLEWSPDGRYILYKRLYYEVTGQILNTGLEVLDTQTGEYITIETNHIVATATWINKKKINY